MIATPTLLTFDAVLGLIASGFFRWAVVRFMTWWLIPLCVTVLAIGPDNFTLASGEPSMVWLVFAYLFGLGLVASGIGTLIGYFLRRAFKKWRL